MSKKQLLLLQMEVFDKITEAGLSPNQYYLMCCLRDKITPRKINNYLEIRHLLAEGWIVKENSSKILTEKGLELVEEIEKIYIKTKTKSATRLMGPNFKEKIKRYNQIFPNEKLPSGKAARSAIGNVETAFKWFFEHYNFKWELIFKATELYIRDQANKGKKYHRTSQYFIRKNNMSDLADWCHALETNGNISSSSKTDHTVKVV